MCRCCLQFARGGDGGFAQYAIKFFFQLKDFDREVQMYAKPGIQQVLPKMVQRAEQGSVTSIDGVPLPPFIVMERGSTLSECATCHACMIDMQNGRWVHRAWQRLTCNYRLAQIEGCFAAV